MKIGIVGLGLIGGSLGLSLLNLKKNYYIYGYDINPNHRKIALDIGLVSEIKEEEEVFKMSDVIFLAIPTEAISSKIIEYLNIAKDKTVVDLGSTKRTLLEKVKNNLYRKNFIAGHPMAGTEFSGPIAAIDRLFYNKKFIICDKEKIGQNSLDITLKILNDLNFNIIYMSGKLHDISAAYVSHISHVTSMCLSLAVLNKEKDEKRLSSLAAGGFLSTARLAKSSYKTWVPIFLENKDNIIEAITNYQQYMESFKNAIIKEDKELLKKMIKKANRIKKIL